MKKVLALLAVAALVGVLISTGDSEDSEGQRASSPPESQDRTAQSASPRLREDDPAVQVTQQESRPAQATPSPQTQKPQPEQPSSGKQDSSRESQPGPVQETSNESSTTEEQSSENAQTETEPNVWLEKARKLVEEGKSTEARKILTEKYLHSKGKKRQAYQELLDQINEKLIWDPSCTTGAETYRLQSGDTLGKVARKYHLNWRMIARTNGIENPARIRAGDELKILTGKPRVLVTKGEFTLTVLIDDYYVRKYPVGIGKNDKTPTGEFTVDNCLVEPVWYKPDGGVVKYGEEGHLLGDRWMGFEDKPGVTGYGIHGTNDPDSMGTKCSQGCVRLRNKDVRELYDFITPGTKVKIVE